jgi:hypothetical protein
MPGTTAEQRIATYAEFWPFYVSEHSKPLTRLLHFAGTTLGVALLIYFIAIGWWYLFPLFFVVEKNRPATFKYPLWSFISDFRMMWFMLTGRMGREVEKARPS